MDVDVIEDSKFDADYGDAAEAFRAVMGTNSVSMATSASDQRTENLERRFKIMAAHAARVREGALPPEKLQEMFAEEMDDMRRYMCGTLHAQECSRFFQHVVEPLFQRVRLHPKGYSFASR